MIKTLKGRISLVYLFLVAMSAVIGVTAVVNLFRLSNSINGLMTANYKSIKVVNSMIEKIELQDYAILLYIQADSKKGIDSFMENQKLFLDSFNIASNNITELGEQNLIEALNRNYMEYLKFFAHLQEIKNQAGTNEALKYYNSKIRIQFETVRHDLKEITNINEQAMFRSKDKATANAQESMYLILIISLLAVSGGFILSRYFINLFLKPVDRLKETVKLIKAGDLNQQAPVIYHDEIGELAGEFNSMTFRLLQYEQSTIGKLMAEKNKSLAIVKSITDPLIVLDQNYRFILINSVGEDFFEIKEEDVINKHFLEVIRNGELFEHISGIRESAEESKQKVLLLRSREQDYYFNVVIKIIRDLDAGINSIVVLFQNITQIKQLEKVKTDFVAAVSHEFKTPLTSIMMGLSLLHDEKIGSLNEKQLETLRMIEEEGETLTTLVTDLLEVLRLDSGRSIFKIRPVSVEELIAKSVKKFLDTAESKEVSLTYEADENLPKVSADPEKITWVLNNLITNALKYTNAGDQILVNAMVKHQKMLITVKDTGMGIPPGYQDKLFDKFTQVKSYDLEVRGTGLGLAIAKEIVEANGGEIWYESALDSGSAFTFTLPLHGGDPKRKKYL
jgi:PAS domain S-box-containing protein